MPIGRRLPAHEKHVAHPSGDVAIADAYAIGVEAALGTMLENRLGQLTHDLAPHDVDVNRAYGRAIARIPAAVEDAVDVAVPVNWQRIGRVRSSFGLRPSGPGA